MSLLVTLITIKLQNDKHLKTAHGKMLYYTNLRINRQLIFVSLKIKTETWDMI